MSIVQWYKSMVVLGGTLMPTPPNGARLIWPKNYDTPPIAGNDHLQNYIEGFQMPTLDVQILGMDGEAARTPFLASWLNTNIMTRTSNDVATVSNISFFDGAHGFSGFKGKIGSFNLSGSKGDTVRFGCAIACYKAKADSMPTAITTAPSTNTGWLGSPIRFQALKFKKNGADFDGIVSFNLTYSNNLTPDMSMTGAAQQVFPLDVNAGMPTCALQLTFQADTANHVAAEDTIAIIVDQGTANELTFTCEHFLPDDNNNRTVGSGRQMRVYSGQVLGSSNSAKPLTITDGP